MNFPITATDAIYAAIMAFFLTLLVNGLMKIFHTLLTPVSLDYQKEEVKKIIAKCKNLFPQDTITFNGSVFKRGMIVRVKTVQNKFIIGEIIGLNDENMLCLLTKKFVVAHELGSITEIVEVDNLTA